MSQIDSMLVKGKSSAEIARMIQEDWGTYKDMKFETLAREIRMYRKDQIDIPMAGRQLAIERSKNPAVQKKLLKAADNWDAAAQWVKLIRDAEDRYWELSKKFKNLPIPPDSVRKAAEELHRMYATYTSFLMDRGLLPRAAKALEIRAEHVIVDESNVAAVLKALERFIETRPDALYGFQVDVVRTARRDQVIHDVMGILRGDDEVPLLEHQEVEDGELLVVHDEVSV